MLWWLKTWSISIQTSLIHSSNESVIMGQPTQKGGMQLACLSPVSPELIHSFQEFSARFLGVAAPDRSTPRIPLSPLQMVLPRDQEVAETFPPPTAQEPFVFA